VIGWGRWTGGTTTGTGNVHPLPLGGSGISLHYAIGKPTAAMPQAGTASFSLLGSTTPTLSSGEGDLTVHKLNSTTMNVDFTAATVNLGLDATAVVDSNTNRYRVSNMPLSISQVMGANSPAFSGSGDHAIEANFGAVCNASSKCSVNVEGFFAGENASRAGLNYRINTREASAAEGPTDSVIGVVTLKKDGEGGL
jgi:hypothetical protein